MRPVKRQPALPILTPTRADLTCKKAVSAMGEYLSAALPPNRRLQVEQHLKECAECEAFLRTYKKTIEVMRNALATDLPARHVGLGNAPKNYDNVKLADELLN